MRHDERGGRRVTSQRVGYSLELVEHVLPEEAAVLRARLHDLNAEAAAWRTQARALEAKLEEAGHDAE